MEEAGSGGLPAKKGAIIGESTEKRTLTKKPASVYRLRPFLPFNCQIGDNHNNERR